MLGWNGVPIARAIEINGESQAGSNPDARFARGLDNLTIRPLNSSLPPDEHWVDVLYRAKNGVVATHREYWLVHKTGDAGESATPHSRKRAALDLKRTRIIEVKKQLYPRNDPATLGSIKDVLHAVKKTVNGQTLGYIRLFSFDVDDARQIPQDVHQADHQGGFSAGRTHPGRARQSGRQHPRSGIAAAIVYAEPNRARAVRIHQHPAELPDLQIGAG